jgi:hypothetical protein
MVSMTVSAASGTVSVSPLATNHYPATPPVMITQAKVVRFLRPFREEVTAARRRALRAVAD